MEQIDVSVLNEQLIRPYCNASIVDQKEVEIVRQALTHKSMSYTGARRRVGNVFANERLEYLGDAIITAIVAHYLYERYPNDNEGFMTRMRAKIVNGRTLTKLCKEVGIDRFIIIASNSPDKKLSMQSHGVIEDAFEAFVGALYLILGFEKTSTWLIAVLEKNLDFAEIVLSTCSYKDTLFKHFQQTFGYTPTVVEVSQRGGHVSATYIPGDNVVVNILDNSRKVIGVGSGVSKKEAENDASRRVLQQLGIMCNLH